MKKKLFSRSVRPRRWPIIILNVMLVFVLSCHTERTKPVIAPPENDNTMGFVVADTITYEVVVVNPFKDDPYKEKFLGKIHNKVFIDSIFSLIETEHVYAYDYETNERLSVRQVKNIENQEGYSRDNIGMVQFTEIWFLNMSSGTMTKKVHSLIPGYNYKSEDGSILGYSPLFRVVLN